MQLKYATNEHRPSISLNTSLFPRVQHQAPNQPSASGTSTPFSPSPPPPKCPKRLLFSSSLFSLSPPPAIPHAHMKPDCLSFLTQVFWLLRWSKLHFPYLPTRHSLCTPATLRPMCFAPFSIPAALYCSLLFGKGMDCAHSCIGICLTSAHWTRTPGECYWYGWVPVVKTLEPFPFTQCSVPNICWV